jgi:hypothetical protein
MSEQMRKQRKLNVSGIKVVFAFVASCLTAAWSSVTGLGAQTMYSPSLSWMFGFRPEKANIIGLRCAAFASLAAIVVLLRNGSLSGHLLLLGFLLFIGSTLGALIGAGFTVKAENLNARRIFQVLGVGLMVWTMGQAARISLLNPSMSVAQWNGIGQVLGIGIVVGALTQISRLLSGTLLIPALYFLCGFTAHQSVGIALTVVFLASLLPNLSYSRQELPEPTYLSPSIVGALVGGIGGSLLMLRLSSQAVLIAFALTAMFLCGRELRRIFFDALPSSQTAPNDNPS